MKVYMYDLNNKLIKEFSTTQDCADFFSKKKEYINHSLNKYKKIQKNGMWFKISRKELK